MLRLTVMNKRTLTIAFTIHHIIEYEFRDNYLYAKDIFGSESAIPYDSYGVIVVDEDKK